MEQLKQKLINSYNKKNKELEKYRDCSSLKDGWQTSSLAKKTKKSRCII